MSAAAATSSPNPVIERLEDQICWYDLKSSACQPWYKQPKDYRDRFCSGDTASGSAQFATCVDRDRHPRRIRDHFEGLREKTA